MYKYTYILHQLGSNGDPSEFWHKPPPQCPQVILLHDAHGHPVTAFKLLDLEDYLGLSENMQIYLICLKIWQFGVWKPSGDMISLRCVGFSLMTFGRDKPICFKISKRWCFTPHRNGSILAEIGVFQGGSTRSSGNRNSGNSSEKNIILISSQWRMIHLHISWLVVIVFACFLSGSNPDPKIAFGIRWFATKQHQYPSGAKWVLKSWHPSQFYLSSSMSVSVDVPKFVEHIFPFPEEVWTCRPIHIPT